MSVIKIVCIVCKKELSDWRIAKRELVCEDCGEFCSKNIWYGDELQEVFILKGTLLIWLRKTARKFQNKYYAPNFR